MACCRHRPIQTSNKKVTPMGNAYEIYALRYATMSPRTPHLNFLIPDPHEAMPLDFLYFVWLLRGPGGREIVVDTGFDAELAERRGRKIGPRPFPTACAAMDFCDTGERMGDVVITHLHYDHAGHPSASLPERPPAPPGPRDGLRHGQAACAPPCIRLPFRGGPRGFHGARRLRRARADSTTATARSRPA